MARARLGRLRLGEQLAYIIDLGDNWQHLCTVRRKLTDPVEALGIVPDRQLPCWRWAISTDASSQDFPILLQWTSAL